MDRSRYSAFAGLPMPADFSPPGSPEQVWTELAANLATGAGHELLRRLSGTWNVTFDFDLAGYGPMMCASGVARHGFIFEGRHLLMQTKSDCQGEQMESLAFFSYDKAASTFIYTVLDKDNLAPLSIQAVWDEPALALRGEGILSNPLLGKRHIVWAAWQFVNDRVILFSMDFPGKNGERIRSLEARYELVVD